MTKKAEKANLALQKLLHRALRQREEFEGTLRKIEKNLGADIDDLGEMLDMTPEELRAAAQPLEA